MSTQTEQSLMPLPPRQEEVREVGLWERATIQTAQGAQHACESSDPDRTRLSDSAIGKRCPTDNIKASEKAHASGIARGRSFHRAAARAQPGKSIASPLAICEHPTTDQRVPITHDA